MAQHKYDSILDEKRIVKTVFLPFGIFGSQNNIPGIVSFATEHLSINIPYPQRLIVIYIKIGSLLDNVQLFPFTLPDLINTVHFTRIIRSISANIGRKRMAVRYLPCLPAIYGIQAASRRSIVPT